MNKKILVVLMAVLITVMMSVSVCAFDPWTLEAMYGTPTVDGVVEDLWGYCDSHTWGDADFGGVVRVMWDENYMYVLHVMTDDFPFYGDWVDTWFDMLANDNDSREDDDVSFSIGPEGDSISYEEKWRAYLDADGMLATALTDDGFIIELKYPYYQGYITPAIGLEIGFTVSGSDDDDGDGVRENPVAASDGNYWDTPSALQDLIFVDSNAPAMEEPVVTPTPTPTPATSDLANVWVYAVIVLAAAAVLVGIVLKTKKTKASN